jgi:hypothetical protein
MERREAVKKICLVTMMAIAMAAFTGSHVRSANYSSLGRDQSGEQKDKGKEKEESAKKVSGALGTKTNPIRCEDPKGERQYLSRLRCTDGSRPAFSRIGSFGVGPYGNILDGYRVKCEGGDEVTVFMDMYHEGYIEKEAVPGFAIVD